MQQTIEKSEDRFKGFAGVTREGIMIHDKGIVVDVNQALADMLGNAALGFYRAGQFCFLLRKNPRI